MTGIKVVYEVEEIRGTCPVYELGQRLVIDSPAPGQEILNMEESDAVCVRVIDNMWTRLMWQFASDRVREHLAGVDGECRISCPMPGGPYTPCGNVIFRIYKRDELPSEGSKPAWDVTFPEDDDTQYPPEDIRPDLVEYPQQGFNIELIVEKVYGCCPVSVEGDKMVFNSGIDHEASSVSSDLPEFWGNYSEGTRHGALCPIALQSALPYINGMIIGTQAKDAGLALEGEDGFFVCPAWGPPTCEALVVFRLHPSPAKRHSVDAWYEELAKAGHYAVPSYFLEHFASVDTKEKRKEIITEWKRLGKPYLWEGWRNPPTQPRRR